MSTRGERGDRTPPPRRSDKRPHNSGQAGGVLLELILFALVLVVFAAGASSMHRSFERRFRAIVHYRNEAVRQARLNRASP